jgi:hypothetical protein
MSRHFVNSLSRPVITASVALAGLLLSAMPPSGLPAAAAAPEAAASESENPQAPSNDDFAAATLIDGRSGRVAGSNVGATVETWEPDPLQAASASVWWTWTAPTDGEFRFDTRGSDIDTVLGVYTGDELADHETVAVNDASGDETASAVSFVAVAGQQYHVQVDSADGSTGDIQLSWAPGGWDDGPVNDDLDDGILLEGSEGAITGSNVGATVEQDEADPLDEASHSVWWTWTAPEEGAYTFSVEGEEFEPVLGVYRGDATEVLTEEAVAVDEGRGVSTLSFEAAEGETYAIQVDG